VAEKLLFEHELFGHQRYIAQMSVGAVKHADVLRSMELFGTEVAPVVRAEVARRGGAGMAPGGLIEDGGSSMLAASKEE
jgi:8-oxo-dGTP pyrophosphatase MutT (NUDIX family)